MTKFRFQLNGTIEGGSVGQIVEYFTKINQWRLETKINGVTVFEIEEKNPAHKGIARKKGL